jgi:hypothetical protein
MQLNTVLNLRLRDLIGLSAIAFFITASYISLQQVVAKQRHFSKLINLAGRQSGQINRIAYFASVMASTSEEFQMTHITLKKSVVKTLWKHSENIPQNL